VHARYPLTQACLMLGVCRHTTPVRIFQLPISLTKKIIGAGCERHEMRRLSALSKVRSCIMVT